jgi:chromosome segregation ATPase
MMPTPYHSDSITDATDVTQAELLEPNMLPPADQLELHAPLLIMGQLLLNPEAEPASLVKQFADGVLEVKQRVAHLSNDIDELSADFEDIRQGFKKIAQDQAKIAQDQAKIAQDQAKIRETQDRLHREFQAEIQYWEAYNKAFEERWRGHDEFMRQHDEFMRQHEEDNRAYELKQAIEGPKLEALHESAKQQLIETRALIARIKRERSAKSTALHQTKATMTHQQTLNTAVPLEMIPSNKTALIKAVVTPIQHKNSGKKQKDSSQQTHENTSGMNEPIKVVDETLLIKQIWEWIIKYLNKLFSNELNDSSKKTNNEPTLKSNESESPIPMNLRS